MTTRRNWAWPLWFVYACVSGIKDALYTKRILHPKHLTAPVISLGSISAGGAGKTPAVIALANLLRDAGYQPDILSRGYGRTGKGVAQVDPSAPNAATLFGDEPVLMARSTHAPVWVASNRYQAGRAAENVTTRNPNETHPNANVKNLHLLDDAFQHRKLFRNIDIALVTLEDLDDEFLPVGNLREAPYALHRADILIIRAEESKPIKPRLRAMGVGTKPLWTMHRTLCFPAPLGVLSAGLRPLALCALARPENFERMLRAAGCGVADTLAFRDHHAYTSRDIDHILATATTLNATGFLTTEKDAVKLTPEMRIRLEQHGPLAVVALEAVFADEPAVLRDLEARLA